MSDFILSDWIAKQNQINENNIKETIIYGEQLLRQAMLEKDIETLDTLISDNLKFQVPTGEIIHKIDDINSYKNPDRNILKLDFLNQTFGTISLEKITTTTDTNISMKILNCDINEKITFKRVWKPVDGIYKVVSGRSLFTEKQK